MGKLKSRITWTALFLLTMTGCAVEQQSTQFSPLAKNLHSALNRLDQQVDIRLNTGFERTLKSGSLWTDIGSVTQGEVLRPYHDVFTLQGSHMHEAYLVVANNTLTGFYLPAEGSFSPLTRQIPLTFSKQEQ